MSNNNKYIKTPQEPINSGFGKHTTAKEVLEGCNLFGKTCIVTGGYSGIGVETTRALADAGAVVIVPARNQEKARVALAGIPRVELEELNLIDPASIEAFAQRFLNSGRSLDILINNAGMIVPELIRDSRGYESQFATNHLGHFHLTALLWPALRQAGSARVVSVSSSGIMFGGVDFEDPNFERQPYDMWKAYGQAKSANALFSIALDKLGYEHGIRAFSLCPGSVQTDLTRHLTREDLGVEDNSGPKPKTTEQGAATSVWCATSLQLKGKGGVYCSDVDIAKIVTSPDEMPAALPWAIDPVLAEQLWHLSEDLTGLNFPE